MLAGRLEDADSETDARGPGQVSLHRGGHINEIKMNTWSSVQKPRPGTRGPHFATHKSTTSTRFSLNAEQSAAPESGKVEFPKSLF